MGKRTRDLMMVSLEKAIDLYLSTLTTEGKSPRYIDWLKTRLRFFNDYMHQTNGDICLLQDLSVDDGRDYIKHLMERDNRYQNHPMHKEKKESSKSSTSMAAEGLFAPSRLGLTKKDIWMITSCAG